MSFTESFIVKDIFLTLWHSYLKLYRPANSNRTTQLLPQPGHAYRWRARALDSTFLRIGALHAPRGRPDAQLSLQVSTGLQYSTVQFAGGRG